MLKPFIVDLEKKIGGLSPIQNTTYFVLTQISSDSVKSGYSVGPALSLSLSSIQLLYIVLILNIAEILLVGR